VRGARTRIRNDETKEDEPSTGAQAMIGVRVVNGKVRTGPVRRTLVPFSYADSIRVRQLIARTSVKGAEIILGVARSTLDAARCQGCVEQKTHAKVVEVLDIVDGWRK
jgi:hypothetical protein